VGSITERAVVNIVGLIQGNRSVAGSGLGRRIGVVRNQRILAAWHARQAENARRGAAGLPPKTRRRRKTLTALATTAMPP